MCEPRKNIICYFFRARRAEKNCKGLAVEKIFGLFCTIFWFSDGGSLKKCFLPPNEGSLAPRRGKFMIAQCKDCFIAFFL